MNEANHSWTKWVEDVQATPEFAAENVKLDFALALERRMAQMHISRAELARKLGTSAAAMTNTLRGDANLSIERMVRLAHALDAVLNVHIAPASSSWPEIYEGGQPADKEWIHHGSTWAQGQQTTGGGHERRATLAV